MSRGGSRRSEWVFCAVLVLATLAVYGDVFRSGFIRFDDPRYITQNSEVLAGLTWDGTVWAFTTLFKSNWHPLTWLSHMLDVELFGVNPAGHHATSVVLHVVNSLLLFGVLRSATGAFAPSAAVAALFALHPTHVESVAWVAERKDVLSTCFGLLATASYVAYARRGGAGRYAATAALLLASLAAKAMLVTLPLVFLLLDAWPLDRLRHGASRARLVAEKLPLLAMAAVVAGITVFAQSRSGAVGLGEDVTLPQRAANAVMAYGLYVWKTLWPADLALVYPHPYLPGGVPWPAWQVAAMAAALVAASAGVLAARRRGYLMVGWLWYLGTLVPVIGLVQVGDQAMADRYTYFPCIGLYIMLAWGAFDLVQARAGANALRLRRAVSAAAVAALVGLGFAAQRQAAYWHDSVGLFEHSLRIAPGATSLRNNLANELFDAGRIDESIVHYRRVVELDPDMLVAHRNLANALQKRGDFYEATRHGLIGRRVALESLDAQLALGDARLLEGEPAAAEAHFRNALALAPASDAAHRGLGRALLARGDVAAAVGELREVVRLDPSSFSDHVRLGRALDTGGSPEAAVVAYRRAAELAPEVAAVSQILADALLSQGNLDEAIVFYRRAAAADPYDRSHALRLANALRLRGEAAAGEAPSGSSRGAP